MPSSCCVPLCSSNYDNAERITVFKFPKSLEKRKQWVRAIHRDQFEVKDSAVVCIQHFEERFLIRADSIVKLDGTTLTVPRTRIKLSNDAFPTIFLNQPQYLTTPLPQKRKEPEERKKEYLKRETAKAEKKNAEDFVINFEMFKGKFSSKLTQIKNFTVIESIDKICILKIDISEEPQIISSLIIKNDLSVIVSNKGFVINDTLVIKNVIGSSKFCNSWSKFNALLDVISNLKINIESFDTAETLVDQACLLLEKTQLIISSVDSSETIYNKISFLKEQLLLIFSKQKRYTPDALIWSCSIYFSFPGAYKKIRSSNFLTLPHHKYLNSLKIKLGTNNTGVNESHIKYLTEKLKYMSGKEKFVNVMLDEIYIKPSISYKGGNIKGFSENNNSQEEVASTIQTFMLSSMTSKNKDVIGLYPVKNLKAVHLQELVLKILQILTEIGYIVVVISSDNNRVNRKMFDLLCGGKMDVMIDNPFNNNHKIFLLFDTVHIFKSIRNNWINQIDDNQTFIFPLDNSLNVDLQSISSSTSNSTGKLTAKFSDLKKLYREEEGKTVKLAPSLNKKVLYPTSIERQNVNLCVKVFDEKNIAALKTTNASLAKGTIHFLKTISRWWKIVNVKSKFKGHNLRDPDQNPVYSNTDRQIIFLKNFLIWLEKWDNLEIQGVTDKKARNKRHGKLSEETQFSLTHTTKTLIALSKYCIDELHFEYILFGKIQTDDLEGRFGQYRQISGAQYHVSLTQILESEVKLKLLSLINLTSSTNGKFVLKEFLNTTETSTTLKAVVNNTTTNTIINTFDDSLFYNEISISDTDLMVLVYITGFIIHKIKQKCLKCYDFMTLKKTIELEIENDSPIFNYIKLLDRGGLKYAKDYFNNIIISTYTLFQTIISERYEKAFLNFTEFSHKIVFKTLALKKLDLANFEMDEHNCNCGNNLSTLNEKCINTFSNILLNNYSKAKNNALEEDSLNKKKRKLEKSKDIKKRKLDKFSAKSSDS